MTVGSSHLNPTFHNLPIFMYVPSPNLDVQLNHLQHTWYDEFVPAHILGWFSKTLIFRDVYFVWFLSILFELLEYSLGHVLHNFQECWWDHVWPSCQLCDHQF
jgi:hypothetical protein